MGFLYIVSIILLIAKVLGLISIGWFLVFLPAIISATISLGIVLFAVVISWLN